MSQEPVDTAAERRRIYTQASDEWERDFARATGTIRLDSEEARQVRQRYLLNYFRKKYNDLSILAVATHSNDDGTTDVEIMRGS